MIYIRPVGGLCNRVRAIDSAIELAKQFDHSLTIYWVLSPNLNASFEQLFDPVPFEEQGIKIINVDPKKNFTNKLLAMVISSIEKAQTSRDVPWSSKFLIKLLLGDSKLKIGFNNNELSKLANENLSDKELTGKEHEANLTRKIQSELEHQMGHNKSSYYESCYRLVDLSEEPFYKLFHPTQELLAKIETTTKQFSTTIGVHIRRTDHHYAIENSPDQLFEKIIDAHLGQKESNSVFLCTDDESLRDSFTKKYEGRIIMNPIRSLDRNDPRGIEDAVVDFYCLSKTAKIYGSHFSSFSQVAADIGNIDLVTVMKSE